MSQVKARPESPAGWPVIGNLPDFARDPFAFLRRLHLEFGDVPGFSLVGRKFVLICHPDDTERVLFDTGKHFHKGYQDNFAPRLLLGNGLATSEGEFWQKQRRLAQPAFHTQQVSAYANTIIQITERLLQSWQDGEVRDVHRDMMLFTQQVVAKTLFDADVTDEALEIGQTFDVILQEMTAEVMSLRQFLPSFVPLPGRARFRAAVNHMEEILQSKIKERRTTSDNHGDLLAMLMEARDDDGNGMTDKQLRDEIITLYFAGYETTANTLCWMWLLLSYHTETRAKLEAELKRILNGRYPSISDVKALTYTEAIIKETLRLYPPGWIIARVASEDVEISGYLVSKGTEVWMSSWLAHRDPRWFNNPETFIPERWLDDLENRLPKYAYFPFGGGPRVCIGKSLAQLTSILLLSTIAQRYRLEVLPNQMIEPDPGVTLRPKHGIKVRLHQR
ncbi:Cytochrome P450 [Nostoc flagelliforme CCNUN1]|uniref:Cytochrome P450 n=1 Tax=Nostoc flagelliforme CCNUN1 TaxID=2038116 RepID=A0A2K8SIZ3_9NOSO|nr:cytochrome P450 [Nostoc flagelliforme]AUB35397.1 Cytochrome P450 [Nostoc flagelliforme CCNUN1]